MRILILNADYPQFLNNLYLANRGLCDASYATQMAVRNESLFGVADFYSRNFRTHGHDAAEIHLNNPWMQYAWARENGLAAQAPPPPTMEFPQQGGSAGRKIRGGFKSLLRPVLGPALRALRRRSIANRSDQLIDIFQAQVESFGATVILNQDIGWLRSPVLRQIKKSGRIILGQIASALPEGEVFDIYDMMISSLPNQVEWFRARGVRAELNRLAFEPSVLEKLGPAPTRDIPLSFVGSLSADHGRRVVLLEYLATRTPLKVWGNGIKSLPAASPLHACYQGEAWGREMYDILRRSRVSLNHHIDLAENWANNMRLYEAPGMGTVLLTDAKRNLHEMYTPGDQVVTYDGAEDCVRQIERLLGDSELCNRIGAAGQKQAIEMQNYNLRTAEIAALCKRLLFDERRN